MTEAEVDGLIFQLGLSVAPAHIRQGLRDKGFDV